MEKRTEILNNGWFEHPEKKVDFLLSVKGILKKIYWVLHDAFFFDQEQAYLLRMGHEVYGYNDLEAVFWKKVNKKAVANQMETIFRVIKEENQWTQLR